MWQGLLEPLNQAVLDRGPKTAQKSDPQEPEVPQSEEREPATDYMPVLQPAGSWPNR